MKRLITILFIGVLTLSGCNSDDGENDNLSDCRKDLITDMVSFEFLNTECGQNGICETFFKVTNLTDCDFQVSFSLYYDRFDSVYNIDANQAIPYGESINKNSSVTRSILHREQTQLSYDFGILSFCEELQHGCNL